mmetsp:Transcript_23731/g.31022  ORF Transcript_23731/g.31022 Transcript_23731/m.31022 type:complete len:221 (-) Transcript_23731:239-901(-)
MRRTKLCSFLFVSIFGSLFTALILTYMFLWYLLLFLTAGCQQNHICKPMIGAEPAWLPLQPIIRSLSAVRVLAKPGSPNQTISAVRTTKLFRFPLEAVGGPAITACNFTLSPRGDFHHIQFSVFEAPSLRPARITIQWVFAAAFGFTLSVMDQFNHIWKLMHPTIFGHLPSIAKPCQIITFISNAKVFWGLDHTPKSNPTAVITSQPRFNSRNRFDFQLT